jgi:glucose/arabinose dehydrogenase
MRYFWILLVISFITISGFIFYRQNRDTTVIPNPQQILNKNPEPQNSSDTADFKIIAENLDTPWAIAFLPDQSVLVTERQGRVIHITKDDQPKIVATITSAKEIGEGGLMGIALDPKFQTNNLVYLYYTYSGDQNKTLNRVVRMTYQNDQLSDEQIILNAIPGASNHNGGRIKFGPDGYLYIGTGDAQEPSQSQDTKSLAGKILRVTTDGKPAPGNPYNNEVHSYGHRNVQGLTWDDKGQLWATEHGPSGLQTGYDEVNLIQAGRNYGWPTIQGDTTRQGMETAFSQSGRSTWAPAGIAFYQDTLIFGGLRGASLYTLSTSTKQLQQKLQNQFGRIREVIIGPDNYLYITTSNQDGRGTPKNGDDKIIKISLDQL